MKLPKILAIVTIGMILLLLAVPSVLASKSAILIPPDSKESCFKCHDGWHPVSSKPGSNLTASKPLSGKAPLTIRFVDNSTGTPTSWKWDLGDGTTSTERYPVHKYTKPGKYTIGLTVSNKYGSDSSTRVNFINVLGNGESQPDESQPDESQPDESQPDESQVNEHTSETSNGEGLPLAKFSTNNTKGNAPLAVQFTDSSKNAKSIAWDFENDGKIDSEEKNPLHVYTAPGKYIVNLTATNGNSTDLKFTSVTVLGQSGTALPVVNFSANNTSGYVPLSVQFNGSSENAISRVWDFNNDGQTDSTVLSPVYVYTDPGTYTVNLTASNANGTASKTATITVLTEDSSSDDSSSGSSDGGSSSGSSSSGGNSIVGSPEPAQNVEVKEQSQAFVTNGNHIQFDFPKNATSVVYTGFDAKKSVGKTTAIVEMLKGKSALVPALPSDEIYKSFNIWIGNNGYATSDNIDNATVCFKVEKPWLQDKNIDQSSVILNWYNDSKWNQLNTSLVGEDDKYLYFTAETPGMSSFTVTGKIAAETEIQPESGNQNPEQNSTESKVAQQPEKENSTSTPGFEIISGIICLFAVFLYRKN